MSDGGRKEASGDHDTEALAVDGDDLAGVVDLFDALTRGELRQALDELAFKRGVDAPPESVVDAALASYHLVDHEGLLVVGPAAFPTLPEDAADLPHIMAVEHGTPPTDAVAATAETRFREEAARTLGDDEAASGDLDDDGDDVAHLVDVSYDLEAWGPVDVRDVRDRLVDAQRDPEEE